LQCRFSSLNITSSPFCCSCLKMGVSQTICHGWPPP
jgi:hypothetical protein